MSPLLNLGEIASRATELAGGRLDWSLSDASFYANIAFQNYIGAAAGIQHTPKEALAISSTTSGGNRIALPTDWDYPIGLTVGIGSTSTATTSRTTTWKPLSKIDPNRADTWHGNLDGGEPEAYVEYSSWVELVPSPDSRYSLNLRYMTKLPQMTSSNDTPGVDEQWHWAGVLKTAELLAASRDDDFNEAKNRGRYIEYMNMVRTDQGKKLLDRRGAHVAYVRRLK